MLILSFVCGIMLRIIVLYCFEKRSISVFVMFRSDEGSERNRNDYSYCPLLTRKYRTYHVLISHLSRTYHALILSTQHVSIIYIVYNTDK